MGADSGAAAKACRRALHELGHARHPSRLNRDQSGSCDSKKYALEELVA